MIIGIWIHQEGLSMGGYQNVYWYHFHIDRFTNLPGMHALMTIKVPYSLQKNRQVVRQCFGVVVIEIHVTQKWRYLSQKWSDFHSVKWGLKRLQASKWTKSVGEKRSRVHNRLCGRGFGGHLRSPLGSKGRAPGGEPGSGALRSFYCFETSY